MSSDKSVPEQLTVVTNQAAEEKKGTMVSAEVREILMSSQFEGCSVTL